MTKIEFLSELENALEGRLSVDEISEIIADYTDIFDISILDGKSEEAIFLEIGSPARIARKILDDAPLYTQEKQLRFPINKKCIDIQHPDSLLRRFGAYVIDTLTGLLILIIIFLAVFVPFSTHEVVTQTDGAYTSNGQKYVAKLYQDNNGLTIKVEAWDSSGKHVFKGSQEEFVSFLDKNKILYPEDFITRTHLTTIKTFPHGKTTLIIFLPYMIFLIFLGVSNMFNAIIVWKFKGYTLGKVIFKIYVEKVDGTKLTFADALLRELVVKTFGNIVTGGLLNIGSFIWACITSEQKTIHDLASKTRVVGMKG